MRGGGLCEDLLELHAEEGKKLAVVLPFQRRQLLEEAGLREEQGLQDLVGLVCVVRVREGCVIVEGFTRFEVARYVDYVVVGGHCKVVAQLRNVGVHRFEGAFEGLAELLHYHEPLELFIIINY